LQEQLLDVLRALSSPNLDIRRKTLDIALDLITSRNIDEVRGTAGQHRQRVHLTALHISTATRVHHMLTVVRCHRLFLFYTQQHVKLLRTSADTSLLLLFPLPPCVRERRW
jgi:hypothetical protein